MARQKKNAGFSKEKLRKKTHEIQTNEKLLSEKANLSVLKKYIMCVVCVLPGFQFLTFILYLRIKKKKNVIVIYSISVQAHTVFFCFFLNFSSEYRDAVQEKIKTLY